MFGSHVTWYTESYRNLTLVGLVRVWYTRSHKLFHIRKVGAWYVNTVNSHAL